MIILVFALALAPSQGAKPWLRDRIVKQAPNPYADLIPKPASGPHVLVISDGAAMTRMNYATGTACERARDRVRLQTDFRHTNTNPNIIYGPPTVKAFCVPR